MVPFVYMIDAPATIGDIQMDELKLTTTANTQEK